MVVAEVFVWEVQAGGNEGEEGVEEGRSGKESIYGRKWRTKV